MNFSTRKWINGFTKIKTRTVLAIFLRLYQINSLVGHTQNWHIIAISEKDTTGITGPNCSS